MGFQRRSAGLITGQGTKIPYASQLKNQNTKQKQYCNKFSKECIHQFSSIQFCPTLCDPIDCSMQGFPVHHHLLVHWVSDAIQPSHPLLSPSPLALNLSQLQDLFQCVGSSHQVAKELEFPLQHQSFQWTPKTDLLQDGLVGSPCSPRDSLESSPTPQFKSINSSAQPSSQSSSHIHTWPLEKP